MVDKALRRWCRTREGVTVAPEIVLPPDTELLVLEVVEAADGPVVVVELPPYYARLRGALGKTARLGTAKLEVLPERKQVCVVLDGYDTHRDDCRCGLCNRNKVSYSAGLYAVEDYDLRWGSGQAEPLERHYGPTEWAAKTNATVEARRLEWDVVNAE